MSDRAVEVRLLANVAQYKASMLSAAATTEAAMGRAAKATSRQEAALKAAHAAGRLAFAGLKVGAVGVIGTMALAAKVTGDFEARMANVQSLSHANATEMKALRAAAMSAGTGYGYTATQVADAQAEMVKAGVSLRDIMGGGLKGALALAAAGQVNVADATEIAASAMTQFRLKGKDLPHVADLLAAGADKALGSVTDLGYGLSQAGTTAHQMGFSIEDTVGTLAEFAQAGQQGEKGGTLLNQMLLQLAAPSKQASVLMDKYHLSLYKANGEMKTMPQIAGNLQRSFKNLDPATRNAALGVIFGSRAIRGANILMADGEKVNRKWIKSVNDQGFAAQQAKGKLNSLNGDFEKLKASGENALIELGSGEQAPLRKLVQSATTELDKLTKSGDLERWGKKAGDTVATVAHDIGAFAQSVAPAVSNIAGAVHDAIGEFNSMPADMKKLLVYGGVGAAVGHKLGLDSLIKGVVLGPGKGERGAAGLASRAVGGGVVPVYVTNAGFGKGGGPGIGVGGSGKKGTGTVGPIAATVGTAGLVFAAQGAGQTGVAFSRSIGAARSDVSSVAAIAKALQNSNVGKYAKDLHINVQRLATDIARYGDKGAYLATVQKRLDSSTQGLGGHMKGLRDFLNPLIGSTEKAGTASLDLGNIARKSAKHLEELGNQSSGTSQAARRLAHEVFGIVPPLEGLRAKSAGVGRALDDIGQKRPRPKVVLDDTASPKLGKVRRSLDDVGQQRPRPQATLVDKASPLARLLTGNLHRVGALHPKPTVSVNDQASGTLNRIRGLMGGITSRTVTFTTIHRDVRVGGKGTAANPTLNAEGGTVEGQRYPYGDKVLTMLAPGEEVISNRYGQADKFRADRASGRIPGYADGGTILGLASGGTVHTSGSRHLTPAEREHEAHLKAVNAHLKTMRGELAGANNRLHNLQQTIGDFKSAVRDSVTHDIFGNGLEGAFTQLEADRNDINAEQRGLSRAVRLGLDPRSGAYRALAQSGDLSTISQIDTRAEARRFQSLYGQRATAAATLANTSASASYGRELKALRKEVAHLHGAVGHLGKQVHEGARKGTREGQTAKNRATHRRRRARG